MSSLNRRNFLKMVGAAVPVMLFPNVISWAGKQFRQENAGQPNVIVLVFDAMSARNLSVYGYPRPTSPNLERFADHATVYHSHYSSGNYTVPGVASLLTGTYPWTHRAINHSGVIDRSMVDHNLFHAFGETYHRLAFPQNMWANFIVTQFEKDVESILSSGAFGDVDLVLNPHFPKDRNLAARALDDFVFKMHGEPVSPVLGPLQRLIEYRASARIPSSDYPRGLPQTVEYPVSFRLEELFDGLISLVPELPAPSLAYLHIFAPHAPYRATASFFNKFIDGYRPIRKPTHRLAEGDSNAELTAARRSYDEYVASADWEFGRLLDEFESSGVFENSYIVITSDHGEMFERGEKAHSTPLLYDPVVHVPLLISSPGQTSRRDVYAPTNAVDLLPTLLNLAGKPVPSWGEGKLLPGLGGDEDYERSTYVVEAKRSSAFGPLAKATIALRQGNNKLIYYTGYEPEDSFELYDLDADIEEMNDLYPSQPAFGKKMRDELLETFSAVNALYMKK
jgi:arylsulfatase A-like enzyme